MKTVMKRCPKCKKPYFWNPDVGQIECPNCGRLSKMINKDEQKKSVSKLKKGEIIYVKFSSRNNRRRTSCSM